MREIAERIIKLDKLEDGQDLPAKYQLVIASLLVYGAKADGNLSNDEFISIIKILAKEFELNDDHCTEMIETGEYFYKQGKSAEEIASRLNEVFTAAQKGHLLSCLHRIFKADGLFDQQEKIFLSQIARAFGFSK